MYDGVIRASARGLVHAPSGERVAPQDSPHSQPRSDGRPPRPDRLLRIPRAGWVEPALASEDTGQGRPIQPDQTDQHDPREPPGGPQGTTGEAIEASSRGRGGGGGGRTRSPHGTIPRVESRPRISACSSLVRAPMIPPRATTTTWMSAGTRGARPCQASRRTRRARFRTTAPPIRRPATKAGRAPGSPGATYSITRGPEARRPLDSALRISGLLRARPRPEREARAAGAASAGRFRPTAESAPWPGGGPGWRDRPGSASGPGTRAASFDGGCSAGRSSSRLTCEVSIRARQRTAGSREYSRGNWSRPGADGPFPYRDDPVEKERQIPPGGYPGEFCRCYAPPRLPPHAPHRSVSLPPKALPHMWKGSVESRCR